jgi:hypothetical protein
VLLGYLVLIPRIRRPTPAWARTRAAGAGLLFGIAVLTKDEAALITILPLAAAAVLRWGPPRRLIALTIGATALPYAVYVSVVAANGYSPGWWSAKTSGIERLLGVIQTTGFHRSGSLSSRLIAEGGNFWTTYALLALSVPAAWLVLRRGGPVARMMGLLYCAAGVTLAYAVALGTLEEQELYLLVVPSLIVISVGFTLRHKASHARRRPVLPRSGSGAGADRARPAAVFLHRAQLRAARTVRAAGNHEPFGQKIEPGRRSSGPVGGRSRSGWGPPPAGCSWFVVRVVRRITVIVVLLNAGYFLFRGRSAASTQGG